ncbi:MAG: dockerin type I repeat-containing protein [Clostridia bacterium]|nr:dockerin type I repeat-containing protein [Clostridia bacterium]
MKPRKVVSLLLVIAMTLGLVPFAHAEQEAGQPRTSTFYLAVNAGESYAVWNEDIAASGIASNRITVSVTGTTQYDIVFPETPTVAGARTFYTKGIKSWETSDYIKSDLSQTDGMLVWIKVRTGKALLEIESSGADLSAEPLRPYRAASPFESVEAVEGQSLECVLPDSCGLEYVSAVLCGTEGTKIQRTLSANGNSYEIFVFRADRLVLSTYEGGKKQTTVSLPYDDSVANGSTVYRFSTLLFPTGEQQKNLGAMKILAGRAILAAPKMPSRAAQEAAEWTRIPLEIFLDPAAYAALNERIRLTDGSNAVTGKALDVNVAEPSPDGSILAFAEAGRGWEWLNADTQQSPDPSAEYFSTEFYVTSEEGPESHLITYDQLSSGSPFDEPSVKKLVTFAASSGPLKGDPEVQLWTETLNGHGQVHNIMDELLEKIDSIVKAPPVLEPASKAFLTTVKLPDFNQPDLASVANTFPKNINMIKLDFGSRDNYLLSYGGDSWRLANPLSSSSGPSSDAEDELYSLQYNSVNNTDYDPLVSEELLMTGTQFEPGDTGSVFVNGGTSDRGSAKEGDTVDLVANPAPEGYEFSCWISEPELEFDKSLPSASVVITQYAGTYYFTALYSKIVYPVTLSAVEGGVLTADAEEASAGDEITVCAQPDAGRFVSSVSALAGEQIALAPVSGRPGCYVFTMPAAPVTLSAQFPKTEYTVGTSAEYGTLTADRQTASIGDTVTLTASTHYLYRHLGLLTVECGGENVPTSDNGDGTFTFTMPAGSVSARAVFAGNCIVTFRNYNGAALEWGEYAVGETPVYGGETPVRPSVAANDYVFAGWDSQPQAVGPLDEEVTYTAIFTAVPRSYAVTFSGAGGTVLQSGNVQYGETPVYTGQTPVRESDGNYVYTFVRWTPSIEPVRSEAVYYPVFKAVPVIHSGTNRVSLVRYDTVSCPFTPEESGYYVFRTSGDEVSPECYISDENGVAVERINYQFSYDGHLNLEFIALLDSSKTYTVDLTALHASGNIFLSVNKVSMHTVRNDRNCEHGIVGYPDDEGEYMLYSGEILWPAVTPDPGYSLLDLIVTDANGRRLTENDEGLYIMPDSDVFVTATFAEAHGIAYDLTDYTVSFAANRAVAFYRQGDYQDCAAEGSGVEYSFEWPRGYIVEEFSVKTESGADVPYGSLSQYMDRMEVWFEMPDEPVTVTLHVVEIFDLELNSGDGRNLAIKAAVAADSPVPMPDCPFTFPEGKEFAGWSVTSEGSAPVLVGAGESWLMTSDTTATATYRDVVPGDANSDGTVDSLDLTVLRQRLADPSKAVGNGADANGDGEVDSLDLTRLRQYLADPTVVLGPQS